MIDKIQMYADRASAFEVTLTHWHALGWEPHSTVVHAKGHPIEFEEPPRWAVIDAEGTKFYADTEADVVRLACILDSLDGAIGYALDATEEGEG